MLPLLYELVLFCMVKTLLFSGANAEFSREDFDAAVSSDGTFAVYYYGMQTPMKDTLDKVLDSIKISTGALAQHDLKIMAADCDSHEDLRGCKDSDNLHSAVLYRDGEVVSVIPGDNLISGAEIAINVLHHSLLPASRSMELTSAKELQEFKTQHQGKRNALVFYIPYKGSSEHLDALGLVKILPHRLDVAYTLKKGLFNDDNIVWFFNNLTPKDSDCDVLSSRTFTNDHFLKSIAEASAVETILPDEDFFEYVEGNLPSTDNLLVLIAGKGVRNSTFKIARAVADARRGIKVSVVDRSMTFHSYIQPRVRDGKIFAMVAKRGQKTPEVTDIGYLENDDVNTLLDLYDEVRLGQDEIWQGLEQEDTADYDDSFYPYPENVLDDPMTFSLHHSGNVKTLYYFDYKTLPRLSDVTYEKVKKSNDYAVVLFTLEFNPRAIAALVTFAEIHKAYKESGQSSPMYRVECYNWPDICEDAGVYTSPRLFFYPKGNTKRVEYTGLWDKASIKDAILRYSNPDVIVIKKKEDILPYNPMTIRSLIGFFENDEGTDQFKKAAQMVRKDYQFIEVHGAVRDLIAESYGVDHSHKTIIGFEHGFPVQKTGTFSTADDILSYLKMAFHPHQLQELSIHSFAEVMKNPKPFLIYFWDQTDGNKKMQNDHLKDMIQDISNKEHFANRMLFTWMDSSNDSVGEFVLKQYNSRAQVHDPTLAFFDKKGSVILKSCETCNAGALTGWLQDCLDSKMKTTYGLNTEEWKPRLEGFDYLELMKEEGTYPTSQRLVRNNMDEDKEKPQGHRSGRTIKVMKRDHKMEKSESMGENSPNQKAGHDAMKSSMHEEL